MKRKLFKGCGNFRALQFSDVMYNKPLSENCSNCIYFSSKNCHLDAANDIEPDLDFL